VAIHEKYPMLAASGDSVITIYTLLIDDQERAKKFVGDVVALFQPSDVVAVDLVRQYAQGAWDGEFYDRVQKGVIERRVQQSREYQAQRAKELERRHRARVAELGHAAGQGPPDIARAAALERNVQAAVDDVDYNLKRPTEDAEYLRAMEKGLDVLKDFDFLKTQAAKRRNEAFQLLEYWEAGFAKTLRAKTKEVLDAEFKEVDREIPETKAPQLSPESH